MNFLTCDQLILNSNSWFEFDSQVKRLGNTIDEGDAFSRLIQLHMKTDPLYLSQFKNVWHATQSKGELPRSVRLHLNLPFVDEGIDLIAEGINGEYTSIQAKYRADINTSLTVSMLATFFNLSFIYGHSRDN